MRHLRSDYDAIQPWPVKRPHYVKVDGVVMDVGQRAMEQLGTGVEPLIPEDEPVFLLRGQDPASAHALRAWAGMASVLGSDPELVRAAHRWADEMEAWADKAKHGAPDVPAGMLPE